MDQNPYSLVMNADKNAFSSLPNTTKFQLMTVSWLTCGQLFFPLEWDRL